MARIVFEFLAHGLEAPNQILGQMFAFALAHFDQIGEGGAQRLFHRRPRFLGAVHLLGSAHDAGRLQDCADRDFAGRVEFFLQRPHGVVIGAGQLGIERQLASAVEAVVITDENVGSAARNIFVDRLANARLELGQIARQIDDDVALLPVHGIEFDAELCPAVIGLAAAVTGHASHFVKSPLRRSTTTRLAPRTKVLKSFYQRLLSNSSIARR